MRRVSSFIISFWLIIPITTGQGISTSVPKKIKNSEKYLFYLHGAIVQEQGINAVSKDFGPYKYLDILDTLSSHGFNVISEPRPKDTDEIQYADKLSKQIDTLLRAGVVPGNIIVVGASSGAYITIDAAIRLKNRKINYVVMGMCWPDTYKAYSGKDLCGNFLSIYESSDPHGSCRKLFEDIHCKTGVKEIKLNMNNSHGFLYQPYKEWVQPIVEWAKATK